MTHRLLPPLALLLPLFAPCTPAQGDEVRFLGNIGFRSVMEELAPEFERKTGHKLSMRFGTVGDVTRQAHTAQDIDVLTVTQPAIENLAKQGRIVEQTSAPLAFSRSGVAVRKGTPRPDVSSPEALKRALLQAKSITYSDPATGAASGTHFAKVLDRLGIADEVKGKTVFHPKPGLAAHLVASGDAELVVQPFQELVGVEGIDIVGPLPQDLQQTLTISVAVMSSAAHMQAANALVDFLRGPRSAEVIRAKGLEPAALR